MSLDLSEAYSPQDLTLCLEDLTRNPEIFGRIRAGVEAEGIEITLSGSLNTLQGLTAEQKEPLCKILARAVERPGQLALRLQPESTDTPQRVNQRDCERLLRDLLLPGVRTAEQMSQVTTFFQREIERTGKPNSLFGMNPTLIPILQETNVDNIARNVGIVNISGGGIELASSISRQSSPLAGAGPRGDLAEKVKALVVDLGGVLTNDPLEAFAGWLSQNSSHPDIPDGNIRETDGDGQRRNPEQRRYDAILEKLLPIWRERSLESLYEAEPLASFCKIALTTLNGAGFVITSGATTQQELEKQLLEALTESVREHREVCDLVKRWRGPLVFCTTNTEATIVPQRERLEQMGIDLRFAEFVTSYDTGLTKETDEEEESSLVQVGIERAVKALQDQGDKIAHRGNVLYIDDAPAYVGKAQSLGCTAICLNGSDRQAVSNLQARLAGNVHLLATPPPQIEVLFSTSNEEARAMGLYPSESSDWNEFSKEVAQHFATLLKQRGSDLTELDSLVVVIPQSIQAEQIDDGDHQIHGITATVNNYDTGWNKATLGKDAVQESQDLGAVMLPIFREAGFTDLRNIVTANDSAVLPNGALEWGPLQENELPAAIVASTGTNLAAAVRTEEGELLINNFQASSNCLLTLDSLRGVDPAANEGNIPDLHRAIFAKHLTEAEGFSESMSGAVSGRYVISGFLAGVTHLARSGCRSLDPVYTVLNGLADSERTRVAKELLSVLCDRGVVHPTEGIETLQRMAQTSPGLGKVLAALDDAGETYDHLRAAAIDVSARSGQMAGLLASLAAHQNKNLGASASRVLVDSGAAANNIEYREALIASAHELVSRHVEGHSLRLIIQPGESSKRIHEYRDLLLAGIAKTVSAVTEC
ncbi:hypothetical protein MRY87_11240 [bacterium]|nr:hypothetical protein [bacterium]